MDVRAQTATLPDEEVICLNILTIVVQGQGMRRCSLKLRDLPVTSNVAQVKRSVQGKMIEGTADEIHVLVGDETLEDSALLSSLSPLAVTQMKAVVWYADAKSSIEWEAFPHAGDGEGPGRWYTDPGLRTLPPNHPDDDSEQLAKAPRVPRQPPPPLLSLPHAKKQIDHLVTEEESAGLEKGTLFKITVFANIFVGLHMFRRCCTIAVSGQTPVAQVQERLEAWLGSRPDELTLTKDSTKGSAKDSAKDSATLLLHERIDHYDMGPGARVLALVWYKNASKKDVPLHMTPRRPSSAVRRLTYASGTAKAADDAGCRQATEE